MKKLDAAIPMGRMAKPEEIANVVAFLADDGASYITATTVFADGGMMHRARGSERPWPRQRARRECVARARSALEERDWPHRVVADPTVSRSSQGRCFWPLRCAILSEPTDKEPRMDLNYTPRTSPSASKCAPGWQAHVPQEPPDARRTAGLAPQALRRRAIIGMGWPKEYGGAGRRPMEQAIVGEEMARVDAPAGVNGLGIGIVGPTIIHHGTEEQKQRYIKKILTAEEIWCQLYSEPNSGSDLASLRTRADDRRRRLRRQRPEDLDQRRHDRRLGPPAGAHRPRRAEAPGHLLLPVDMQQPGVEVRPLKQITGSSRVLRSLLDQRARPGREPDRRVERRAGRSPRPPSATSAAATPSAASRATTSQFDQLSRSRRRCGATAARASTTRWSAQKLGQIYAELEVLRYAALRVLSRLEKGQRPGPESSIAKLYYSELDKRLHGDDPRRSSARTAQLTEGRAEELDARRRHGRRRRGHLGLLLPLVARRHDLRRLQRDPEEHHRRARARPAEGGARRPDREGRRWISISATNRLC